MSNRQHFLFVAQAAFALASVFAPAVADIAQAQVTYPKPVIYPARGQSPYQQSNDDAACYSWARQQSGVDPAYAATVPAPVVVPGGQRVVGAARGAAAGSVAGAIAGDAGKGAAAGAAIGAMAGGIERRQERREIAAYGAQAQVNNQYAMSSYWHAWRACMAGRGYTVE
ncbi:MAG TPA: glycine zipper domain-containing protein [Paraburkholderia sp.]|uniref:glycine zipper domain-containing protein n=1 Tax=Paraburkholderia sp. TaxID=1926495 RepID=UPI002B45F871|nr:glycine zipper domain-containing protein [Paraburkholderia sp.]HKR45614.1 glycine zipper domain-containing protein [Paraburkholderia sp.]